MNITKTTIIILMLLCAYRAGAQNVAGNMGMEESQKAGAMGGSGGANVVSVDPFTGTGSVNIPLHSYSIDGLNLGVSLSYSCKGIQVDQMAGSAGLGWNLSAGGEIVREVLGLEDEVTLPTVHVKGTSCSPYTDHMEGRMVPGASSFPNCNGCCRPDDMESDIFHMSLPGKSVSFSFDGTTHEIITTPKSEIKIEFATKNLVGNPDVRDGQFTNISGITDGIDVLVFTVTDEQGHRYYFERGDYQKPKRFGFAPHTAGTGFYPDSGDYYPTNRWVLDKIITNRGSTIQYYYDTAHLEYVEAITETYNPGNFDPLEIKEQKWKGVKYHIKRIEYPGTTIYFELDKVANARCDCQRNFRLRSIKIEKSNSTGTNSLTYKLNHNYFNVPKYGYNSTIFGDEPCANISASLTVPSPYNADSAKKEHLSKGLRLKLNSIDRIGTDNITSEVFYEFEYQDGTLYLPYRFASNKDWYGYFNGITTTRPFIRFSPTTGKKETYYLSIPEHPAKGYCGTWGTNRTPNEGYMAVDNLIKVKNGMGVEYLLEYDGDYELENPYAGYRGDNSPANGFTYMNPPLEGRTANDGLVVSKVTVKNNYNPQHSVIRTYNYVGGIRINQGGYMHYEQNSRIVLTNYFVSPFPYYNGSNHGFSHVVITTKNSDDEQISKTSLQFSNLIYRVSPNDSDSSCLKKPIGQLSYANMPGSLRTYRMGLLLKSINWDETGRIISVEDNTYEFKEYWPVENKRALGLTAVYDYPVSYPSVPKLTRNVITRSIASGLNVNNLATVYDYVYDDHENVKTIIWEDSKGDKYKKHRKYNYDYYASYPSNTSLADMHNSNIQAVLSNETWKMNGTTDSLMINFSITAPSTVSGLKYPASFNLITSAPVPKATANAINRGAALNYTSFTNTTHLLQGKVFTKYDAEGQSVETRVSDHKMNSGTDKYLYTSTIMEDNNILAEAHNARYDDIAYTSFESTQQGNWNYDLNSLSSTESITGKYSFQRSGATSHVIISNALTEQKYILSFWANVSSLAGQIPITLLQAPGYTGGPPITCTLRNTVGNWHLFTAEVSAAAGDKINLATNFNIRLDELRLYPIHATMATYTYTPMFGPSSVCDASNYILYYEYDAFGNLTQKKDMRKNILRKTESFTNDNDDVDYTPPAIPDCPTCNATY